MLLSAHGGQTKGDPVVQATAVVKEGSGGIFLVEQGADGRGGGRAQGAVTEEDSGTAGIEFVDSRVKLNVGQAARSGNCHLSRFSAPRSTGAITLLTAQVTTSCSCIPSA